MLLGLIPRPRFFLLYWSRIYAIARIGEAILARLRPASSRAAAFVLGCSSTTLSPSFPSSADHRPLVVLFGMRSELIARKQFYLTARRQDLL
jgi:hypothetical protein